MKEDARRAAKQAARRAKRSSMTHTKPTPPNTPIKAQTGFPIPPKPAKKLDYNWQSINAMDNARLANEIKRLQKEASQRLKSATRAQKNIRKLDFERIKPLLMPVRDKNRTAQQYRGALLHRAGDLISWLNQATTTRAGFNHWVETQRYHIANALRLFGKWTPEEQRKIAALTAEQIQDIASLMGSIQEGKDRAEYDSSSERNEAYSLYMEMRDRMNIDNLKDYIREQKEEAAKIAVNTKGPADFAGLVLNIIRQDL